MEAYICYVSIKNRVKSCLLTKMSPLKAKAFIGVLGDLILGLLKNKIKLHTTTHSGYINAQISPAPPASIGHTRSYRITQGLRKDKRHGLLLR